MQLVGGYPYWLIKDGLLYNYPALDRDIATNVLVIGGGISGAMVAYELANAGIECIVVDAHTIGLGSTCASTSLLQYEIDSPLYRLMDSLGKKAAVKAYKLNERAVKKIGKIDREIKSNCFEKRKSLYYATTEAKCEELRKEYEARKENGFKVKWLTNKALRKQYGIDAPGAILSAVAGQIDVYHFTHALHQRSIKKKVQVFDRTKVTAIESANGLIRSMTDKGFVISSKNIVYANGYEAVNYIDPSIVEVNTTYAVASTQFNPDVKFWTKEVIIWNTAEPYLYMRTTPDRRILAGGHDEQFSDQFKLESLIEAKTQMLKKDVEQLFPYIEFEPEFSWSGTFVTTKDGLPFIGALEDKPNHFFALGFGGNGITYSQVASEMIRDMIVQGKTKNGKLFSFERLKQKDQ